MQPSRTDLSPYPTSPVIESMTIAPTRQSIGHGDNWAITWGDDDKQYAYMIDGRGFGMVFASELSMAPVLIEGSPPDIKGYHIGSSSGTVPGPELGALSRKVSGLVMINGTLYAWVRNLNPAGAPIGTGASLIYSEDHGTNWTWVDWSWPHTGYPVWMNAGQDYAAAKDGYAYFISPDGPSAYADYPDLLMGRVDTAAILDSTAYRYYGGTEDNGTARWGSYADRQAVFTDPNGCFRPNLVYNPGLDRYLLLMSTPYGDWQWWRNDNPDRLAHFAVFDAPNPWGPWTTVEYIPDFGKPENRFSPNIPPKWISEDGTEFYLQYSVIPNGPYRLNLQPVTLQLR